MEFLGRDPDLAAEPELLAVGESGGCVDHHHGAVGPIDKGVGCGDVLSDDRFCVSAPVGEDVLDSGLEVGHDPHRHHQVEVLGVPVLVAGRGHLGDDLPRRRVAAQLDTGVG